MPDPADRIEAIRTELEDLSTKLTKLHFQTKQHGFSRAADICYGAASMLIGAPRLVREAGENTPKEAA